MPQERTLPISPGHREFTVKVNGSALERSHQLLAASVVNAANKIPSARLVYLDGSASDSDFPLSNADTLAPGAEVEVMAGTGDDTVSIFKGIVIQNSLKAREQSAPQLIVECRHKVVKLTVGRNHAYFQNQTDSEVIESILAKAGIQASVESTPAQHKSHVQFGATDWDFILTRAAANGKLVIASADNLAVQAPRLDEAPACTLQFGSTMLEFDAEMDARRQFSGVKASSWDPAQQAVVAQDAADPGISTPGNIGGDTLAQVMGLSHLPLAHPAITEDEAKAWADSEWLRSRLSRVHGRIKCEGIATIHPGNTVTLDGVGKRFNGKAYVTGVRHEFDTVQGWKTHVQFGGLDSTLAESDPLVSLPKASGLLPGVQGLQIGVVVSNEDPDGEHRVRVRMPMVSPDDDGAWARVAVLDAGKDRGFFFRPEIGDEVILGFLHDDPRQAVILGMVHSSANTPPLKGSDDNHEKTLQSRSKMKLYFNDHTKVLRIETPSGNRVTLSEEEKSVTLADQNGNKIEMTPNGILIQSDKAIEVKAGTSAKVASGTSLDIQAGSQLKLAGSAGAELSSSAITKVAGSMVQLN